MTLEEKVGQMAQFTLDVIGKGPNVFQVTNLSRLIRLCSIPLLENTKLDHILNTANNRARTPEVWEYIVRTIQGKGYQRDRNSGYLRN